MILKILFVLGILLQVAAWILGGGKISMRLKTAPPNIAKSTHETRNTFKLLLCRICLILGALCIWTIAWIESDLILFWGEVFLTYILWKRIFLEQKSYTAPYEI